MHPFIHDDFLLTSQAARELYHGYAVDEPIFDYHCHLSPADLATNRRFNNLTDIWLEGDHYKWRAMRLHGTEEQFCTGDAGPFEKFQAFAATVPHTLRNPIYHWTHLELARYFGITTPLTPTSAKSIWEQANDQLQQESHTSWGILEQQNVRFIGTTDDPTDSLEHHITLKDSDCPATVAPTFRPDPALGIQQPTAWNHWLDRLSAVAHSDLHHLEDLKSALAGRIDFFDSVGCRASDHGLERCPLRIADDAEADLSFQKARNGKSLSADEAEGFAGNLLTFLGERYAEKRWVMQLHLGAIRNVNTGLFEKLGPDIGCDSIGDQQQIPSLALLLGELSKRQALPKTILYNLNPRDNYAFASMCGNFFEGGTKAKVQFGSGWWFLDQSDGMKWQLNALSQLGLLSHFIGMLTDSRSMMSFPRHEYFRRLLCELLGQDIADGKIPHDIGMVGEMVKNISYSNAQNYFD
ncbi:glucuronate isomerase [Verrucomicrobiaceae bacterium N1E253]|uniref:Uronate isomerase n=1 Tax=Oceaniferula marina TaxID=2748318 RepID=A0A851GCR6_9BACT|nr:glucuronate isomerase [Oceaniferula marina]NWK55538.1 glucuronate isomerase [Oceaniferula marina]